MRFIFIILVIFSIKSANNQDCELNHNYWDQTGYCECFPEFDGGCIFWEYFEDTTKESVSLDN